MSRGTWAHRLGIVLALTAILAVSVAAHAIHPFYHRPVCDCHAAVGTRSSHEPIAGAARLVPGASRLSRRAAGPCPICSLLAQHHAPSVAVAASAPFLAPAPASEPDVRPAAPRTVARGLASPRAPPLPVA